jgi:hypothetical protein
MHDFTFSIAKAGDRSPPAHPGRGEHGFGRL